MSGHIKLERKIIDWEWYKDINTKCLFIHLLLKANWKDGRFCGKVIERGSLVTSLQKLSEETGLTVREVRTALTHLEDTGEIEKESTSKYTVISLRNYKEYQDCVFEERQANDKQATSKRQASDNLTTNERHHNDKRTTTIEEEKEGNKKKKNNIYPQSFEDFWSCYPRKKEKRAAYRCYKTRLKEYTEEELMMACKAYAKECKNTDTSFIKHASTFLGPDKPFAEYLDTVQEDSPKGAVVGIKGWL